MCVEMDQNYFHRKDFGESQFQVSTSFWFRTAWRQSHDTQNKKTQPQTKNK